MKLMICFKCSENISLCAEHVMFKLGEKVKCPNCSSEMSFIKINGEINLYVICLWFVYKSTIIIQIKYKYFFNIKIRQQPHF